MTSTVRIYNFGCISAQVQGSTKKKSRLVLFRHPPRTFLRSFIGPPRNLHSHIVRLDIPDMSDLSPLEYMEIS